MQPWLDLTSLRGKITSAYIVLVVGIMALGVIAFSDLLFLGRQVMEGEVVSNLKDTVLEMRREEKNLFLYADEGALSRADEYAARSQDILQQHKAFLGSIVQGPDTMRMFNHLLDYRANLQEWNRQPVDNRQRQEQEIRQLGHQIYLSAESIATQERKTLEAAVQESKWFLLLSLFMIGFAILFVGRQLRRVVLRPLKKLESKLMPIAEGRFSHLLPPSDDREFITFTSAFNRMLKELEIRQKRMLQSEKLASLGILAAGVAHELNNPLSNISSSCQLLMEELQEASPEQLNTWLRQIDSETERGRDIVRTLLDFGGQRVFQKHRLKLADILDETQTIIRKTLRQYAATLSVEVPGDLMLEVDKQRMLQLFINLIQNALHAAGEGVHVTIRAGIFDRGANLIPPGAEMAGKLNCITDYTGKFIGILVSDDGPGIPKENLSKIFDPFFTTSEPGQGVGLGLFIVQEIVREHDGCLAIASTPGEGVRVIVLLPDGESADE